MHVTLVGAGAATATATADGGDFSGRGSGWGGCGQADRPSTEDGAESFADHHARDCPIRGEEGAAEVKSDRFTGGQGDDRGTRVAAKRAAAGNGRCRYVQDLARRESLVVAAVEDPVHLHGVGDSGIARRIADGGYEAVGFGLGR